MEFPEKDGSNQSKEDKNINSKNTYKSYLELKSRNIFIGWKRGYFALLEGKTLLYTKSGEKDQVIGNISIQKISNIQSIDDKTFKIKTKEREYILRADNEETKNNWMDKIKYSITCFKKGSPPDENSTAEEKSKFGYIFRSNEFRRLKTISKKLGDIIIKHGYKLNIGDNQSQKNIEKYGINKLINFDNEKILKNIHYGYMFKKGHETYNKRWFFIFSRGCLLNIDNFDENPYLEEKYQKEWLKFDTLYYFKDKIALEKKENVFDGEIKMDECHRIINDNKDGK
jgi:hypothetical protein